jgi:hypothetical protein
VIRGGPRAPIATRLRRQSVTTSPAIHACDQLSRGGRCAGWGVAPRRAELPVIAGVRVCASWRLNEPN